MSWQGRAGVGASSIARGVTVVAAIVSTVVVAITVALPAAVPARAESSSAPPGAGRAIAGMISAGSGSSCVIVSGGALRCWGLNGSGQLGIVGTDTIGDNETPSSVPAVDLGAGRTARSVAANVTHACAVLDDGSVRCWGNNGAGQVGVGRTSLRESPTGAGPVSLGAGRTAVAVDVGLAFTCALLDSGAVRCWGANSEGRLGQGHTRNIGDDEVPSSVPPLDFGAGRSATAISTGDFHACAILDDGSVRCWGFNSSGELGYGHTRIIGDDETPASAGAVDIGAGRRAVAISAGTRSTCVVLDTSAVRCWGQNTSGQLGVGHTRNIGDDETPGSSPTVSLRPSAPVIGLGRTQAVPSPFVEPRLVAVTTGGRHACAIASGGALYCWGSASTGQTGHANTLTLGDDEVPGSAALVNVGTARTATAVSAGFDHTCAALDDGTVRCWGENSSGDLGYGNTRSIGDNETPGSVPSLQLGGSVTVPPGFSAAPTAIPTADGATVSWVVAPSVPAVARVVVTSSTGQRVEPSLSTNEVTFTRLPAGIPVSFTVEMQAGPQTVAATTDLVIPGSNRFVPLPPQRILDTRTGVGAPVGAVPAGGTLALSVLGRGGVPTGGVSAVVLNVTATETTGPGFVTASPAGVARPEASNLNIERAGQTIPNLVTVAVGASGVVDLFSLGGTHLIADVAGYYTPAGGAQSAGRFVPLDPARVLDTRSDPAGAVGAGVAREVAIGGAGGVPATGAAAVVLNVTVTEAAGPGFLTVFPTGGLRPEASSLNHVGGQTIANQVVVPLGVGGRVSVFASAGTHVVIDVAGWFTDDSALVSVAGLFLPVTPTRALDTRSVGRVGASSTATVAIATRLGVPAPSVGAVVLNLTVTEAAGAGFVTAYPAGSVRPTASNVNVERVGHTIPNHAVVRVGAEGAVTLFTQSGGHLIADIAGWYVSGPSP